MAIQYSTEHVVLTLHTSYFNNIALVPVITRLHVHFISARTCTRTLCMQVKNELNILILVQTIFVNDLARLPKLQMIQAANSSP